MSYRIEYRYHAFRVQPAPAGEPARFVVAIEGGDNNVTSRDWTPNGYRERRARDWEVCMLGTELQVLRRAVYFASGCEGGGLRPLGRHCTPESYIRRIRTLLDGAGQPDGFGSWAAAIKLPLGHGGIAFARSLNLAVKQELFYGQARVCVDIAHDRRDLVFEFADRYPDLMGWQLARAFGLPPQ